MMIGSESFRRREVILTRSCAGKFLRRGCVVRNYLDFFLCTIMRDLQLFPTKKSQNHALKLLPCAGGLLLEALVERACLPCGKDQWINVGLAADCNGIAKFFSDFFL